ncbi:MAG: tryptophan synthase alpha chain [Planctomycetota bacterium]|nr:MAG: tryptophan synthase alpha chain [Planctomycetota bacterium]
MGRIAQAFARGRPAFIPFVMAGDPSLEASAAFVRALAAAGADVIELGVPFSDPIADGPTNQRAAERALAAGTTPAAVLELVAGLRAGGLETPLVLFSYLNPLLALGDYAPRAAAAGADGLLVVDLPPEEALEHEAACAEAGLDRIYLAAPSSGPERLARLAAVGSGFVYYVSRYGVTGARKVLPSGLGEQVRRVRVAAGRPVAVGFGIATPEQAAAVAAVADGVVVGSALVEVIAAHGAAATAPLGALATRLARAVHGAPR